MNQIRGSQSISFGEAPYLISSACVAGSKEAEGPLGKLFDMVNQDDLFGAFCAPVIRLFACGKSFPHSDCFTIRIPALFFPQVENPVEKVQNSSVQACFPGGIPHFPQGFPQSYLDRLRILHTFCNFQVRIMTKF